jgi:hypothetical protein
MNEPWKTPKKKRISRKQKRRTSGTHNSSEFSTKLLLFHSFGTPIGQYRGQDTTKITKVIISIRDEVLADVTETKDGFELTELIIQLAQMRRFALKL